MKLVLVTVLIAATLALSGCGGNSGRCNLGSKGYPLCGI